MKNIVKRNLVLVLCLSILASFQKLSDDTIFWLNSRKLAWTDYKRKADQDSKFSAITKCGYGYDYSTKKDSITIKVNCYFIKNSSWVKENAKIKALLQHEQCHFDLTELFARRFRKLISTMKFKRKTAGETIDNMFNKHYAEYNKMQELYDKETDISRNSTKQSEWEKNIAKELKGLNSFSAPNITLVLLNKE